MSNYNNQNNEQRNNILAINIKIICSDENIEFGDNEHNFYCCFPSNTKIKDIKENINQVWTENLRGNNYIFKMNDILIRNDNLSIQEANIRNGAELIIVKI